MNQIYGFIFADEMEYAPFRKMALSAGGSDLTDKIMPMVSLAKNGDTIYAVQCGIGKVNASIAASLLIQEMQVDTLLNAGLSGAISKLRKGDVVAGTSYVECDFDLRAFDLPLGKKSDGTFVHEPDSRLLHTALTIPGMKQGALGTGDFFLTDPKVKDFYKDEFGIQAFDMETAAIAAVADKYSIPFLSIRKISDDADDSALDSYTEMNNLAEEDLSAVLLQLVGLLRE